MYRKRTGRGSGSVASSVASNRLDILNADKYQCAVGGEWKPLSGFSKRQQGNMENKVKRGMKLTPTTTGMICREHTGEQRLERRCEGPCNQIKTLADFSKNTLANNRNWCKTCILWQESFDDKETEAAENVAADPSPSRTVSLLSGDDNFDDEIATTVSQSLMYTASNNSRYRSSNSTTNSARVPDPGQRPSSILPPHLQSVSEKSNDGNRSSGTLPPHLRSITEESNGGVSLPQADFEEDDQPDYESLAPDDSASQYAGNGGFLKPGPTRLTAAALRQKQQAVTDEQPARSYDGWELSGRQHMQRRIPGSEVGTIRSLETRDLSTVSSSQDWRSGVTTSKPYEPVKTGRNGKWAKIPYRAPSPRPPMEYNEEDVEIVDDGSEPELP